MYYPLISSCKLSQGNTFSSNFLLEVRSSLLPIKYNGASGKSEQFSVSKFQLPKAKLCAGYSVKNYSIDCVGFSGKLRLEILKCVPLFYVLFVLFCSRIFLELEYAAARF